MKDKQYIKLPQISNQKIRQKYYTPESISHPAKANISMMHWILKKFVKDGDLVLDPMCGIGTTMIEGMRLFPNSLFIGIELEHKFVNMTKANIDKTNKIAEKDMFAEVGQVLLFQGDARELSQIMKEKVNKIISSPPFGQAQSGGGIAKKGYDGPKHTPTDLVGKRSYMPENIGDKQNISNLPYGQADKIVSSPPYQHGGSVYKGMMKNVEKAFKEGKITREQYNHFKGRKAYNEEAAGSYVEKIITSPPFGGKVQHKTNYLGKQKKESGFEYSDNPENIGNMPQGKINKIVTSPPYSKDVEPHTEMRPGANKKTSRGYKDSYSESKINIGSLIGKTYLGEMLRVYRECFKILKSGGFMILITKDFIRQKKRIRLGEDTIKLCQAAGFTFKEIYYRKIEHPSFWRILYQQKYPSVEKIDSEDILIFKKP